jgi:glycerol kinase
MTVKKYILVLDQGTTSSRALLIDKKGHLCAMARKEFRQIYPQPGWVEHDPMEIWSSQYTVAKDVLKKSGVNASSVAGIGITNQRETTIVWDRDSGRPIFNAIVWQDRRTSEYCDALKRRGLTNLIQKKTGLVPDAYFSATKIKWILDHIEGARSRAKKGQLDLTWDNNLLNIFTVPQSMLPQVKSSSEIYGETEARIFGTAIPIAGVAGDQQAALFGQMCHREGMIKNTYGTGCFMMMNTGHKPIKSKNNLLTTLAWVRDNKPTYALEGSIFIAGAVVQWLRDGLGIIKNSSDVENLARQASDNGGVYLVPAFTGLGAPHWDQYARGIIIGITRGTTSAHIARAALESIAYQTKDVLDAMTADSAIKARELRVDGGATVNSLLMQFQSDILGLKVVRPKISESTAMGAGFLAGLAVGFWPSIKVVQSLWQKDLEFSPHFKQAMIDKWLCNWKAAIGRTRNWSKSSS